MKIKLVCILAAGLLVLSACGAKDAGTQQPAADAAQTQEQEAAPEENANEENSQEAEVGMANPWVETTEEEANELVPRLFVVPDGAVNAEWHMMDSGTDFPGPLVQLNFDLDGLSFCARAQVCAEDHEPIDGMYYDWTVEDEGTLAGWGNGEMRAQFYRYVGEDEYADLCTWFDYEIGIAYCLSTTGKDLDGFDIQAVVEAMYPGDEFMPSSFVEEDTQKTEFDSYDEVISYLQPGQGYTYIKVLGADEEVLGISDEIFDLDGKKAGTAIYVYGKYPDSDKIENLGNTFTEEGKPLRTSDGLIYCCDDDCYEADCIAKESGGLMVMEYIFQSEDENGGFEYSGFLRKSNSVEDEGEDLPDDADVLFVQRQKDAEKAPVIEFTVVE
ncbi:MAG: hypothetical protein K6E16_04400 [Lachnospiraceae bacterium]|nr:hypothetical protein [Lachnospiraceae bacterium]